MAACKFALFLALREFLSQWSYFLQSTRADYCRCLWKLSVCGPERKRKEWARKYLELCVLRLLRSCSRRLLHWGYRDLLGDSQYMGARSAWRVGGKCRELVPCLALQHARIFSPNCLLLWSSTVCVCVYFSAICQKESPLKLGMRLSILPAPHSRGEHYFTPTLSRFKLKYSQRCWRFHCYFRVKCLMTVWIIDTENVCDIFQIWRACQ